MKLQMQMRGFDFIFFQAHHEEKREQKCGPGNHERKAVGEMQIFKTKENGKTSGNCRKRACAVELPQAPPYLAFPCQFHGNIVVERDKNMLSFFHYYSAFFTKNQEKKFRW